MAISPHLTQEIRGLIGGDSKYGMVLMGLPDVIRIILIPTVRLLGVVVGVNLHLYSDERHQMCS